MSVVALVATAPLAWADAATDLDAARNLIDRRRWNDAARAYERLFEEHEGDAGLIAERVGIERDLQLVAFHKGRPKPTGDDLFGSAVVKFSLSNRKVELLYERGTGDRTWEGTDLRLLPIRFEDVTVTVPADGRDAEKSTAPGEVRALAILAYNPETSGGYRLVAADEHVIDELDADGLVELKKDTSPLKRNASGDARKWIRFTRRGSELRIERHDCSKLSVRDNTHEAGYVGLTTYLANRYSAGQYDMPVRIEGRVEETWLDQRIAEREHAEFQVWKEKEYDRDAVLPDWLIDVEIVRADRMVQVPDWLDDDHRDDVTAYMRFLLTGGADIEFDPIVIARAARAKQGFVNALLDLHQGRLVQAEKQLSELIEAEEDFVDARLWLALTQLHRRRLDSAEKTLDDASELLGDRPMYFELRARRHLLDGDLDAARDTLTSAQTAGAWTDDLAELTRAVMAARRGPQWKRSFHRRSTNFEVYSNHSADLCGDVANILQDATRRFVRTFRPLPDERLPTRVYVFASKQGYVDFGRELGTELGFSAGAYLPRLHIMVVWLPIDRRQFEATVRHEAFHQFAHHFAEELPFWLNEGWAEYYGNEARGRSARVHETDRESLCEARDRLRTDFSYVPTLMRMTGAEYMEKAAAHYVQSWLLITALSESDDEEIKAAMRGYLDAVLNGESRETAYGDHMEPVLDQIHAAVKALEVELATYRKPR